MKKLIATALLAGMTLSLAACGAPKAEDSAADNGTETANEGKVYFSQLTGMQKISS